MEATLKPMPVEELDQDGKVLEVGYEKAPGGRTLSA